MAGTFGMFENEREQIILVKSGLVEIATTLRETHPMKKSCIFTACGAVAGPQKSHRTES